MEYPKRLMGWVKVPEFRGCMTLELRFRHTPNLFEENIYRLESVKAMALPTSIALIATIGYAKDGAIYMSNEIENPPLRIGREILVVGDKTKVGYPKLKWFGHQVTGSRGIWLQEIPDNIKGN